MEIRTAKFQIGQFPVFDLYNMPSSTGKPDIVDADFAPPGEFCRCRNERGRREPGGRASIREWIATEDGEIGLSGRGVIITVEFFGNLLSRTICFNHRNNIGVSCANTVNSALACGPIINGILRRLIEPAPNIPRHYS